MKKEYDFTDAIKNPYPKQNRRLVTIRLDPTVIEYFKKIASEVNMPYQTLINSYLVDCVKAKRTPTLTWK